MGNVVVCGIDASPASVRAAGLGAYLDRELGSDPVLLHVEPERARGVVSIAHARERGRLRALAEAHDFSAAALLRVETGDPARTLVQAAHSCDAELVVVGSRGRPGPAMSLGSVAAHVVRQAPCPVVLVPPHGNRPLADGELGSVVCAIQESRREPEVLTLGDDLAARVGARLYAVHAFRAGLVHPATTLLSLAEEMCADLIVTASEPNGLAAVLATNARCPVVALPPNADLAAGSGHYEVLARAA